jgi:hypothetical protein
MRVYARCVAGLEDVWTARMEASLRPPGEPGTGMTTTGTRKGKATDEPHDLRNKEKLPPEPCQDQRRPGCGPRGGHTGAEPGVWRLTLAGGGGTRTIDQG